ncbi:MULTISPECIES: biopolymer transporter ExbD [unclassified Ereboglobus]|uniref:ExbD/TolR family protein n=1 Tax=unclassified Ereboglobus TaxID=2626932 RepID=UPI0024057A1C|nr:MULTISPECIES: biopolymer transporter ExbD [unclassified Ereboglobus]
MNPDDFGDVNRINAPIEERRGGARFDLTAMISVLMFLLVTFVMFSLALTNVGKMDVNIAGGCGGCGHGSHEPLVVQVSENTTVYINKEPYDISDLPLKIASYKEECARTGHVPRVLVSGDDRARYALLARAIDHVKTAGIEHMVLESTYRMTGR